MTMRSILSAFTLTVLTGCTDLVRTNPFDPDAKITFEIHASRDTLTAVNQRLVVTGAYSPPNEALISWSTYGGLEMTTFSASGPAVELAWVTLSGEEGVIRARVGLHSGTRTIALSQRFGGISFQPCALACVVFTDQPSVADVPFTRVDSGRATLAKLHPTTPDIPAVVAHIKSRNPAVAQVLQPSDAVTGVRIGSGGQRGSTWLVYESNHVRDSALVFADWKPASMVLQCPATVRIGQRTPMVPELFGQTGERIAAPIPVRYSLSPTSRAVVLADGQIQGASAGAVTVTATDRLVGVSATCVVQVTT
jgi:hypothetical protein